MVRYTQRLEFCVLVCYFVVVRFGCFACVKTVFPTSDETRAPLFIIFEKPQNVGQRSLVHSRFVNTRERIEMSFVCLVVSPSFQDEVEIDL